MRTVMRCAVALVLAACEGGAPRTSIGSVTAIAEARDAAIAPSDGALAPNVRARLPATPIRIAVPIDLFGLSIGTLDKDGLHVDTIDDAGHESFAWLDEHTLVTLRNDFERGWTVTTIADGVRGKQVTIPEAAWKQVSSTLRVTRAGEVYLYECTKWAPDYGPCVHADYVRMLPARGRVTSRRPAGVIEHRNVQPYIGDELWPLPPTVAGPRDVTLAIDELADANVVMADVHCTRDGNTVRYPGDEWDPSYGFTARRVRWVMVTPPIYEVTAAVRDPVDQIGEQQLYFRACDTVPFDNFAWLADGVWATYDQAAKLWTVYAGDTPVGTIAGIGALRATGPRM